MTNKIEHNGKLYDVGASYLIGNGVVVLRGQGTEHDLAECGDFDGQSISDNPFECLQESPYTTGTITDAPKEPDIELEDGEWYLCNYTDDVGLGVNVPLFRFNKKWYRSVVEEAGACDRCDKDVEVVHKLSKQTVKPISREKFDVIRYQPYAYDTMCLGNHIIEEG